MPVTIYGIKNCDTMKKARGWLDGHKVTYTFHDYKTAGIERGKLEGWAKKVGWESLLKRDSVPDRAKLYFAGRLASQTRNAEGLEAIVQDFFGIRTELLTFVGRWLKLPTGSTCKLVSLRVVAVPTTAASFSCTFNFWKASKTCWLTRNRCSTHPSSPVVVRTLAKRFSRSKTSTRSPLRAVPTLLNTCES